MSPKRFVILALLTVLFLAYLYGTVQFPLRGEEANRILTAYEMVYFKDFFNPTHLGEPYYSKPPLFMHIVALFSSILGWSVFSARFISVVSSFLTAFLVYVFSLKLFKERTVALLSALILLTFGDIILFYGFLAEIDAFYMFITFLGVVIPFIFLQKGKETHAFVSAGFLTALAFLTKGFPALYHIPLSFLILLTYFGRLKALLSFKPAWGLVSLTLPLLFWFLNLKFPVHYLKTLWAESFSRTPLGENKISQILKHLISYPLLNLKQLLPHSLTLPFLRFEKNKGLFLLLALSFANYLPYLISPGARGRYILVIFPFLSILFAQGGKKVLIKTASGKIFKLFFYSFVGFYILSLFFFIKNWWFFKEFGIFQFLYLITPAALLLLITSDRYFSRTYLTMFLSLMVILKVGFINFYAPIKEKKHPEREIAKAFVPYVKKQSVIIYLPKSVNMELCAYLDIYTGAIVLRKPKNPGGGEYSGKTLYGLTKKNEIPKDVKVLKIYKGWVLFSFDKSFQNSSK